MKRPLNIIDIGCDDVVFFFLDSSTHTYTKLEHPAKWRLERRAFLQGISFHLHITANNEFLLHIIVQREAVNGFPFKWSHNEHLVPLFEMHPHRITLRTDLSRSIVKHLGLLYFFCLNHNIHTIAFHTILVTLLCFIHKRIIGFCTSVHYDNEYFM